MLTSTHGSYSHESNIDNNLIVQFSETEHFFTSGVDVEITSSICAARIFFTTDGSLPTTESVEYSEPIYLKLQQEVYAVVLRAVAKYEGMMSPIITHTYFVGENVNERFGDGIYIFSLSANPDYLFGHEYGILVGGALREEFINSNPDREIGWWTQGPANFNMRGVEWEREIHVETFFASGERVLVQYAGVRVHGASSRFLPQKTLRVYARSRYSPNIGRFNFDFFPDNISNYNTPIISTNTFFLGNGQADFFHGDIRNELAFCLARRAGLLAPPTAPAAVFINGEYYAFAWLRPRVDERYLQDFFVTETRDWVITTDQFPWARYNVDIDDVMRTNSWIVLDDAQTSNDLELMRYLGETDLIDDVNFARVKSLICIDNFLLYFAFNIYIANDDWPGNNSRLVSYRGSTGGIDSRWKRIVVEADVAFDFSRHFDWITLDTLNRVLGISDHDEIQYTTRLFANLLSRTDMADLFTIIMCDLAANIITTEKVDESINSIFNESVWNEYPFHLAQWGEGQWVDFGLSIPHLQEEHEIIRNFAATRHEYIFQSLSDYFGFPLDMYTVKITGGEAIIGTQRGTSSRYFNHLVVPITPILPEFTAFDHWLLNGEPIYESDITVSLADAIDGYVSLELVTRPFIPPLVIADAFVTERGNGSSLLNPHDVSVRTTGLFLSNCPRNLHMWQLPAATVPTGAALELAGRRTGDFSHRFNIQMNFDIRDGQVIFLSDANGQILDRFTLRGNTEPRDLSSILGEGNR